MKKPPPFATEVDLCAAFLAALPEGWTAYAETAGWDILLVRGADGFQIGIQAKLKLNLAVLTQAIEELQARSYVRAGPDCRAVLVPEGAAIACRPLAPYLCLTVIEVLPAGSSRRFRHQTFEPELPRLDKAPWREVWFELAPEKRHKLPAYIPDCRAGDSSPLTLTEWKVNALKVAVLLEVRGYVTRADFRHIGIDHRRWIVGTYAWLVLDGDGRWVRGPGCPDFAKHHPRNFLEVKADLDQWAPRAPLLEAVK